MFSLLLPFSKTSEKLHSAEGPGKSLLSRVASPQLYMIVNGKPKKLNIVWCTLINVDRVKAAITKLKETNWLYKEVQESSLDDATQKVIEVASSSTKKVLEKATTDDIAGFQSYTIRCMDNQLPTNPDIKVTG